MYWRKFALAMGAVVAVTGVGVAVAPVAWASVPAPPRTTKSWYVVSLSTQTAYNDGYAQGQAAAVSPVQDNEVFLDFGAQNSSNNGTTNWQHPHTYAEDISWAEYYAKGWYVGTGVNDLTSVLHLVISTNNSGWPSAAQGTTFANSVVDPVAAWVVSNNLQSQVIVDGGIDAEPVYASWSATKAWVDAFDAAVNQGRMVDFGSADGCSYTDSETTNSSCSNGWTRADEAYIAWNSRNYALPEIYTANTATQWTLICRYSYDVGTGKILYDGPLTTSGYISATTAWDDFWTDLNGSSHSSQSLSYISFIAYQY